MNKISVLIISNTLDFGTDYICLELEKRHISYFRINRDLFSDYEITFDVLNGQIKLRYLGEIYIISTEFLQSIYYRAPIYLRDNYQPNLSAENQLYRSQWTAFIRNLAVFENVKWVNNPVDTFKAENKLYQLKLANELGLKCPETIVTNSNDGFDFIENKMYIFKSLDTALIKLNKKNAFLYTTVISGKELKNSNLSQIPILIQDYLTPKIDLRVTIIGTKIFTVKITKNDVGLEGDWRYYKNDVSFTNFSLPSEIESRCLSLMDNLNLNYGAIDLILSNNNYYFIEINPTGEWAWLVDQSNLSIDKEIAEYLIN